MDVETIKQFLKSHPAINASAFSRETGISKRYLDYILTEERPLTDTTADKLRPVMVKYGWQKASW
jgi:plasmid maintenance system antidote protein VapI